MHITLVLEYVTCAGVFPCLSASSFNIGSSRRIGSSGEALEVNGLTAVIKMADILKKKFSNAFIWAKLYHNPIAPYPQWWTFYRRHFQMHFIPRQFSKFWFPSQRASNVESVLSHDVIILLTMVYHQIPADYTRWRRRPLCGNAVPTSRYQSTKYGCTSTCVIQHTLNISRSIIFKEHAKDIP